MSAIETTPAPGPSARRADLVIRVGAVVFAIGTLGVIATLTPFLIGADPLPRAVYLVSLLMPAGFGTAVAGLVGTARAQRRTVPDRSGPLG